MKIFLFALFVAAVSAAKFSVKDGNTTCILLDVEGQVEVVATNISGVEIGSVNLPFANANTLDKSNCSVIVLNLTKSVEVWFKVEGSDAAQAVQPIAALVPSDIFSEISSNDSLPFTASKFGQFTTNQSYVCLSSVDHVFGMQKVDNFTLSVNATTQKLHIQFAESTNGTFNPDEEVCKEDLTTTPTPTTSASPTTSSAAPATSTTAAPEHEHLHLNVTNGNETCVLMAGALTIAVTFEDAGQMRTGYVNVPGDAVASGNCSYNTSQQSMSISFGDQWLVSFIFSKDDSNSGSISITEVGVQYNTSTFGFEPSEIKNASEYKTNFLKSSSDTYYMCNANSTFLNSENVTLTSSSLKYKAFTAADPKFGDKVTECSADEETSSVVPIAVGAALAGLVVIVLIAYLIGRRRSRKSGYESV